MTRPKKVNKTIWGIKCPECKKRMFSFHRHDSKLCGCPNQTMIDGGRDYIRCGWKTKKPTSIRWSKSDGKYPTVDIKSRFPY